MSTLLADVNVTWYLPPLIVAISLVYSATRFESWRVIWIHAFRWAVYIVTFLGGTYAVLYLVSLDINSFWYIPIGLLVFGYMFLGGRSRKRSESDDSKSEPGQT